MRVQIQGQRGSINLSRDNFVDKGGQGSVFAKGDLGFKIYTNKCDIIPHGKIQQLAEISDPRVINPKGILLNGEGDHIGHTFRFVQHTYALQTLFPKGFRRRHSIDNARMLHLIKELREGVDHIHSKGILLVDMNELNFLVPKDFGTVYFIDVDSYETKGFPAGAITPSIRDWHTPLRQFTEGSDWFSFAVLAFQMFIGIHPYRGTHARVEDLTERMKQNLSVLGKDIKLPPGCMPLEVIPPLYKEWFVKVLERGERIPPPDSLVKAVAGGIPLTRLIKDSRVIDLTEIVNMAGGIVNSSWSSGTLCVLSPDGIEVHHQTGCTKAPCNVPLNSEILWTPKTNSPLFAHLDIGDSKVRLNTLTAEVEFLGGHAEVLKSHDGRLYAKNGGTVYEVLVRESGTRLTISSHIVAKVGPLSSKLFEGLVIQSVLGEVYVNLFVRPKESRQVRVPELSAVKTLDIKYQNGVMVAIVSDNGTKWRYIFRFSPDLNHYTLKKVENVSESVVNFTVLETGTTVMLTGDSKIVLFSNKHESSSINEIDASNLPPDMQLKANGSQLTGVSDCAVMKMRMI